jgi:DNA-binding MarR family transcriptional regulator
MKTTIRIAELLDRLTRMLRNDFDSGVLKPVHWEVLRFLHRANRFTRTPRAVTAWLGITKGTVSQSLNTLERSGFIKKLADANDKRIVRLALTASGNQLLDKDPLSVIATCLEDANPDELQLIEGVFEGVLHKMLAKRDNVKFGICHTRNHFQQAKASTEKHRCDLLKVNLGNDEKNCICIEHDSRVAISDHGS